jgi:hypothetical protein
MVKTHQLPDLVRQLPIPRRFTLGKKRPETAMGHRHPGFGQDSRLSASIDSR